MLMLISDPDNSFFVFSVLSHCYLYKNSLFALHDKHFFYLIFFPFINLALQLCQALERCKEGKIGFGSGYNIKTSILQAIYDCPFLSHGVEVMLMFFYFRT